jgi:hypothetical protein
MSVNAEAVPADTDPAKINPNGRREADQSRAQKGELATPTAETAAYTQATLDGAVSASKSAPNDRAVVPEPPGTRQADPPIGQPVDGLALWDSEGGGLTPAAVDTIRLDQNERLLVPFTMMMVRVSIHYVNFGAISGYVLCNGPNCLLCRIGRQQEIRDLWPVYDLLERAVKILPITQNLRPHALRPQLAPVLRQLGQGEGPLLISLRSDRSNKFTIATLPVPRGADDGVVAIRSFLERVQAGQIGLASAYPMLTNSEWAAIDEVKTFMVAKGLVL